MRTGYDADAIVAAFRAQLRHGRYAPSDIYFKAGASQSIVESLATLDLYTQKRFCDPAEAGIRTR
jgi:hypothetical protein